MAEARGRVTRADLDLAYDSLMGSTLRAFGHMEPEDCEALDRVGGWILAEIIRRDRAAEENAVIAELRRRTGVTIPRAAARARIERARAAAREAAGG